MRIAILIFLLFSYVAPVGAEPDFDALIKGAAFADLNETKAKYDEYAKTEDRCTVTGKPDLQYCKQKTKSSKEQGGSAGNRFSMNGQCAYTAGTAGKAVDDKVGALQNKADIKQNSDNLWTAINVSSQVHSQNVTVCEKCLEACAKACPEAVCDDKTGSDKATCESERQQALKVCQDETKEILDSEKTAVAQLEKDKAAALGTGSQAGAGEGENEDQGGTQPEQQAGQQPATQQPQGSPTDSGTQQQPQQAQNGGGGAGGMEGLAEMMKPKEEAKEEEEEEEAEAVVVDCATDEKAYLYKECTSKVLSRCTAEPTLSMCASFNARYCAAADGAAAESSSSTKGAGYGSDYCKTKAMGEFCSVPSHAGICPSCTGAGMNTSPDQAHNVSFACDGRDGTGKDPYYSSPGYQSHLAAAGGGSGGGGVSAGDGTAPVVQSVGGETALEDTSREGMGLGVDSAGGYSSPGGSGVYGEESTSNSKMKKAGKRTVASAASVSPSGLSRRVTDVGANQFGNVFSIGSEVIRIRCLQGKHLHCAPEGK